MTATRATTRLAIRPIDHFVGARFSRRAWRAVLVDRATDEDAAPCEHYHGHRTIEAAKKCGTHMWRKLP